MKIGEEWEFGSWYLENCVYISGSKTGSDLSWFSRTVSFCDFRGYDIIRGRFGGSIFGYVPTCFVYLPCRRVDGRVKAAAFTQSRTRKKKISFGENVEMENIDERKENSC